MQQPFVRFDHVEKSYDGKQLVVRDLTLDIAQGEFLTLLGPSGSGKTTTLMMLAGFETATSGEIYLDGKPINRIAPEHRNIGMVFQSYALFPHMTVAENVGFPLSVRRITGEAAHSRVMAALDKVGLKGLESRRPAQMSGGQQQRVAVARALVFEPKLVLMDEPLSALDKQLREQLQYEIKRLHNELGITIVYVTHDQTEALAMSDRIAVFHQGRIQQIDIPTQLYERPANAFVAQFIGENNTLSGTVHSAAGNSCQIALADGTLIAGQAVSPPALGAHKLVSIRPERVRLNPQTGGDDSSVSGTVVDITYLGRYARLRLKACGLEDFIVTLPNDGRDLALAGGNTIHIGWDAADCRVLDSE
jgi:putative spermidine/putrescine transport system ATP-binding protein